MASLLTLEAIGPKGEDLDDQELQAAVFGALTQLDPEWQTQLRVAE